MDDLGKVLLQVCNNSVHRGNVHQSSSLLHLLIIRNLLRKKYPVVPAPTRARVCCSEELSVLVSVAHVTTKDHTDIWGLGHNL